MRAVLGLVLIGTASAAPVDPARLPPIEAGHAKSGDPAAMYLAGVDADVVMSALRVSSFVALAGAAPVDGKLGDVEVVTADAAFDAIAPATTLRLARATGSHVLDIDVQHAAPLDLIRLGADTAGASYVFAPQHPLPAVTVHAKQVDAHAMALAVAKLAGLELVEHGHVWMVVEPGAHLDAKLLAQTDKNTRVEINRSHPGEARRLLHPDLAQDQNVCPKDTWIDASLHGETGALEAVLATLTGAACEQTPNLDELDTSNAQLLGILVGPKLRRAVFRVPHGARAFEPTGQGQRVEVGYVVLRGDENLSLHAAVEGGAFVAPGPFEADRDAWQLRGTVRVGTTWRAIFRSRSEWRVVAGPGIEITAGTVHSTVDGKPRRYTLER